VEALSLKSAKPNDFFTYNGIFGHKKMQRKRFKLFSVDKSGKLVTNKWKFFQSFHLWVKD